MARWLYERSRLPAEILRRLSSEPIVLRELDDAQAAKLAVRLRDNLPSALDGLDTDELHAAMQSPCGWTAVTTLIERVWVECHETLPASLASGRANRRCVGCALGATCSRPVAVAVERSPQPRRAKLRAIGESANQSETGGRQVAVRVGKTRMTVAGSNRANGVARRNLNGSRLSTRNVNRFMSASGPKLG